MTKKWIGINLLLLIAAILTGRQLYVSVLQFKADNSLAKIQPDPALNEKIAQESILPPALTSKIYNASEFAVLPEKNLFTETRTSDDSQDGSSLFGGLAEAQKPILVGVMINGNEKYATILEPQTQGRGRSSAAQTKRIGDTYQGYSITEIAPDHIVLDNGRQKETINLRVNRKPAQRGKTAAKAIKVIPIGGGATTGNIQVAVVSGTPGARSPAKTTATRIPSPEPDSAPRNVLTPVPGIMPAGQPQASTPAPIPEAAEGASPSQQTPAASPGGNQRKSRVLRSPFGDIVRQPEP